ncbi:MAG: hypothetical protein ABJB86_12205 [Bacteroidota bacterium]
MSSIVTLVIVLLVIIAFCLSFMIFHSKSNQRKANSLSYRLNRSAKENNIIVSLIEEFKNFIFGYDPDNNKLIVCKVNNEFIIDLDGLKECRKQKKWLAIPVEKNGKGESHLEKISLLFEFHCGKSPDEIIFYEYKHNSIFQMHELEQKADYWQLVFNKKILIQ